MPKELGSTLKSEKIQSLKLRPPITVAPQASLQEVIGRMESERIGCVVVADREKPLGIFTERDILTKIIEAGIDLRTTVERAMTPKPVCLKGTDSVAEAIRVMNKGHYRHLPIVAADGRLEGILTAKTLVAYLAEHYPLEVYNLPPDPRQVQSKAEGA